MKQIPIVFLIVTIGLILGSCASQTITIRHKPLYLAQNIWYEDPTEIESINFIGLSNKIPAGTLIEKAWVSTLDDNEGIGFYLVGSGKRYRMCKKIDSWHWVDYQSNSGNTITPEQLLERTFTTKPFEEMTAGMTPEEIDNIKKGSVTIGMSKEAVLISWGYPPLHFTPSLDLPVWRYWFLRKQPIVVEFDAEGKVMSSNWSEDE